MTEAELKYAQGRNFLNFDGEITKAVECFLNSSEKGYLPAKLRILWFLHYSRLLFFRMPFGWRFEQESEESTTVLNHKEWFESRAKEGSEESVLDLAIFRSVLTDLSHSGDEVKCITLYKELAEKKNPEALFILGVLYQEKIEALKRLDYLISAADVGHFWAKFHLAIAYTEGLGGQKYYEKAFSLFLPFAEKEFPTAQVYVGDAYATGKGIKKDRTEAFKWYIKAGKQQHPGAIDKSIALSKEFFDEAVSNLWGGTVESSIEVLEKLYEEYTDGFIALLLCTAFALQGYKGWLLDQNEQIESSLSRVQSLADRIYNIGETSSPNVQYGIIMYSYATILRDKSKAISLLRLAIEKFERALELDDEMKIRPNFYGKYDSKLLQQDLQDIINANKNKKLKWDSRFLAGYYLMICQSPNTKSLDFSQIPLRSLDISMLAKALSRNVTISSLNLKNYLFQPEDLKAISRALEKNHSLVEFLYDNDFKTINITLINRILGYCERNKKLNESLLKACQDSDLDGVTDALNRGASLYSYDESGNSPLHNSMRKDDSAIVNKLLDHASVRNLKVANITDGDSITIIDLASEKEGDLVDRLKSIDFKADEAILEPAKIKLEESWKQEIFKWELNEITIAVCSHEKTQSKSALPAEVKKVLHHYQHHPVPGFVIGDVQIIYNPILEKKFKTHMRTLESYSTNEMFKPDFATNKDELQRAKDQRISVAQKFEELSKPFTDINFPNVKFLATWHGTKAEVVDNITCNGYANLAKTDHGFYGKGIYTAFEASYCHAYSDNTLILNWLEMFSAYPVIPGDKKKLEGKGNFSNYDAHFVPVNKNGDVQPIGKDEFHEIVVFQNAACLPRYRVTVVPQFSEGISSSIRGDPTQIAQRSLELFEELQTLEESQAPKSDERDIYQERMEQILNRLDEQDSSFLRSLLQQKK